jgi:hypothetical protein
VAACQAKSVRDGVVVERPDRSGDQVRSDRLEEHVLRRVTGLEVDVPPGPVA